MELSLFDNQNTEATTAPAWQRGLTPKQIRILELRNTRHKFWNDPGHGWLEVQISDLKIMGIDKKISGYSYRKDDKAYLEEDCDMSLYIETLYESDPIKANIQNWCNTMLQDEYREHIFVRSLRHY
jgi:hypothetical protein